MRGLQAAVGLLLLAVGCSSGPPVPGNENMGTFNVSAHLTDGGALPLTTGGAVSILDGGTGYTFTAILSRQKPPPAGGPVYPAWLTVNQSSRDGGFDGQFFTSVAVGVRAFDACHCGEGILVTESVDLAVLSATQAGAAGGTCPPNVLDGGLPSGPGISLPATSSGRFDAQLLCGELVDRFDPFPDAGCGCLPGTATFSLSGVRQ